MAVAPKCANILIYFCLAFRHRSVPLHMRIPAEFSSCDDKQYGVESRKSYIFAYIKGYPEPKVTWFFRGKQVRSIRLAIIIPLRVYTKVES